MYKEGRNHYWPSLKTIHHTNKQHITKTKRKQNNLGTRSRTTGDPDAGDFRKRMEYLQVVFMELSVSKGG